MAQKNDFVEIVFKEGIEIKTKCFKHKHDITTFVKILTDNLKTQSIVVLDLHNVADLFVPNTKFFDCDTCVLSFVGRAGKTRDTARDEIINRINTGQIKFGMLVFNRPKPAEVVKSTNIEDFIGTKAWVINKMKENISNSNFYFVDDSSDHVFVVEHYMKSSICINAYLTDGSVSDAQNKFQLITNKINENI